MLVASQLLTPHIIGRNNVDIGRVVAIKTKIDSQTDDVLKNNYNPAQVSYSKINYNQDIKKTLIL